MKETQYSLGIRSVIGDRENTFNYESADGVTPKDSFSDSELLIADEAEVDREDTVLVVQSGFGFLGPVMATKAERGYVTVADTSARATELTRRNMEANDIDNFETASPAFYSELDRKYDTVVYAPGEYEPVEAVKHRISHLTGLLAESGKLFVSGRKETGINRYTDLLDSSEGELEKIATDGGYSLHMFQGPAVDYVSPEKSFERNEGEFETVFHTYPGLFSPDQMDEATRILSETVDTAEEDEVLDLACGYGALGITLEKTSGCDVTYTDDSSMAVHFTERNLEANGLESRAIHGDVLDRVEGNFDIIVSNPPTHAGRGVTEKFFSSSAEHLKEGGELYIVCNRIMAFEDRLLEYFEAVEELKESRGYKVLKAVN